MGVAQSTKIKLWELSSTAYDFYANLNYTCSRNDSDNTYTVKFTKIEVHGKDWNFKVNYTISLWGSTETGYISATGNGSGERWISKDLNFSTTINGDSNGHCPDVWLSYTIYNNSVWHINKKHYDSYTTGYLANIASIVESESAGPNKVWSEAGPPTIKEVKADPSTGKATVKVQEGVPGRNNPVSGTHLYYNFDSTDLKKITGTGTKSTEQGVTYITFPIEYPRTKKTTTLYARAYTVTDRENDTHHGSSLGTYSLKGWEECAGSTVTDIEDNGNNTFTVTTKKGVAGANNSVNDVYLYYSQQNSSPSAGGSNCSSLTNGIINGDKVTFPNIPIKKSGRVYTRAVSVAARGDRNGGQVYSEVVKYYDKPVAEVKATPKSLTEGRINITESTQQSKWDYRYASTKAGLSSAKWTTGIGADKGVSINLSTEGKLIKANTLNTIWVQVRRNHWTECVSDPVKVTLDLCCPTISVFNVSNVMYTGTGHLFVKAAVPDSKQGLKYTITMLTGSIKDTTTEVEKTIVKEALLTPNELTKVKTTKLATSLAKRYQLRVWRTDYPFLESKETIIINTRASHAYDVEFVSAMPSTISINDSEKFDTYTNRLELRFRLTDAYKYITAKNIDKYDITQVFATIKDLTPNTNSTVTQIFGIDISAEMLDEQERYVLIMDSTDLEPGHTYSLKNMEFWCENSGITLRQNFNGYNATVSGSVKIGRRFASVWIYDNGEFKNAVPYVYNSKSKKWHRAKV